MVQGVLRPRSHALAGAVGVLRRLPCKTAPLLLLRGMFGHLPGRQTVPRAKLYALIQLLSRAQGYDVGLVTVTLDCMAVVKRWRKGPGAIGNSRMEDMWHQFGVLHRAFQGFVLCVLGPLAC